MENQNAVTGSPLMPEKVRISVDALIVVASASETCSNTTLALSVKEDVVMFVMHCIILAEFDVTWRGPTHPRAEDENRPVGTPSKRMIIDQMLAGFSRQQLKRLQSKFASFVEQSMCEENTKMRKLWLGCVVGFNRRMFVEKGLSQRDLSPNFDIASSGHQWVSIALIVFEQINDRIKAIQE